MRRWRARADDCKIRLTAGAIEYYASDGSSAYVRELHTTILTVIRFLAGMCTNMDCQGAPLDKALTAA
jgi:hypothetical protein